MRLFLGTLGVALLAAALAPADDKPKDKPKSGVVVDKDKRTVSIDARVAPRKIDDPRYTKIYPIEVVACWKFPEGQKAHETVVTIEAKPSEVHKALEELGLKPGKPSNSDDAPEGPSVNVYVEWPTEDGGTKRVPMERILVDIKTLKPIGKKKGDIQWRFTGSAMRKPDPNKDETVYGADLSGTLISIFPVTDQTVLQTQLTMKEEKFVKLETDKELLPKEGTPVKLVIEVPSK
jgi:hypothetical protein